MVRAAVDWVKGADHREPAQPPPVLDRARADYDTPPASGLLSRTVQRKVRLRE